jgi:hypothetical protein
MHAFERHEKNDCHAEAIEKYSLYRSVSAVRVSAQLSKQLLEEQRVASKAFSTMFTTVQYLAGQGLALRGHT